MDKKKIDENEKIEVKSEKTEVKSEVKTEKTEVKSEKTSPVSSEGTSKPKSADSDKKPVSGTTGTTGNRYQSRPSRPPYNNRGPQSHQGNRGNFEGGGSGGRRFFYKKKVCKLCVNKTHELHFFKDLSAIKRYVTERGKILPRRMTGTCAKHQRLLAREVKKARIVALIPFESK